MNKISRRSEARLDIEVPARLNTFGGKASVKLCDLSPSGARIKTTSLHSIGSEAVLSWLGFEAVGRVMWTVSDQLGLRFSKSLSYRVLEETRLHQENKEAEGESELPELLLEDEYVEHR